MSPHNTSLRNLVSSLKAEVTQLMLEVDAMRRLINKLSPLLAELDAIDSGVASPIGDVTKVDFLINQQMVEIASRHHHHFGVGAEYINDKATTVFVAQLKKDMGDVIEKLNEKQALLRAYTA